MRHDPIDPTLTMEWVAHRLALAKNLSGHFPGLDAWLQPGWDITTDVRRVDDPGVGIYRAPHPLGPSASAPPSSVGSFILRPGMTASEIEAGLYRQARIFPTNHRWRWDTKIPSTRDCFSVAVDPDGHAEREGIRDKYLTPFLGVTIEDLALCLADWSATNPDLARLIMAKSFAAIGETEQLLPTHRWPAACLKRFQRAGITCVVPPVLAFVAHAALAQFAQTHGAHLLAGYSAAGAQLTAKSLIDDLPTRAHARERRGTRLLASAAFLQTFPLVVKDPLTLAPAEGWGDAWVAQALDEVSVGGVPRIHAIGDRPLGAMIQHHPALISRATDSRRSMLANRPLLHWQGLTMAESAAVNLTLLTEAVKGWVGSYGHDVSVDRSAVVKKRPAVGVVRAIAAVRLAWLETCHRAAFTEEAYRILLQQEKDQNPRTKGNDNSGVSEEVRTARICAFRSRTHAAAREASIEDLDSSDFGDSLWRRANVLRDSGVGRIGQPGWQYFAHPHLWIHGYSGQAGGMTDLSRWAHGLAKRALGGGAPEEVVDKMSLKGLRSARRRRATRPGASAAEANEQKIAAEAVQALGLMLSPQSTDPMLRCLVTRRLEEKGRAAHSGKTRT